MGGRYVMDGSQYSKALNVAIRYLSYRSRTEYEMKKYLKGKSFDLDIITRVIDRLKEIGYINDKEFISNYINYTLAQGKKGIKLLELELTKKGISPDKIKKYIHLFEKEDEINFAIKLANDYFIKKKEEPLQKIKFNLYNNLKRKGFTEDSIKAAMRHLDQDKKIRDIIKLQRDTHIKSATKLAKNYYKKQLKKETNDYILKNKVKAYLSRRGYDYSIVTDVLNNLTD